MKERLSVSLHPILWKYSIFMGFIDLKSKRLYMRIFVCILASSTIKAWLWDWRNYASFSKKGQFRDNSDENLILLQITMAVLLASVDNTKPTPKKRVGKTSLNNTSSGLDTSLSPKGPRRAPNLRELILDIKYDKLDHWNIHWKDRPRYFL